jgi:endonuclease III-like uncharacterized protein
MNIYVENTDQKEMLRKSPLYQELTKRMDGLEEEIISRFDNLEKSVKTMRSQPSVREMAKRGLLRYRQK